ncbi:MAG: glycosyltransferase family 4 protein [Anaerolineae bacterium]
MIKRLLGLLAPLGVILVALGIQRRQTLKNDTRSTPLTDAQGQTRKRRRACFISQRTYPVDQRLYTEILALQEAGYEVHIICTRDDRPDPSKNRPNYSVEDGVHIHRIPSIPRARGSKIRYILEYASFTLPAFLLVTYLHFKLGFHLVHVTNMTDLLLISALVPRYTGAKVIFDIRECSPEMFNDRLGLAMDGTPMKFIIAIEQWAVRFAHVTVTCTDQMKEAVVKRGADPDKIVIILNVSSAHHPTPVLPDPNDNSAAENLRMVTHGTIIKRYGHTQLIQAMPHLLKEIPNAKLEILGKGEYRPTLEKLVADLKLEDHVNFAGFVKDEELVERLRRNHFGIVSLEQNPEADLVHTHKMFEYIELGIPVVISRTVAARAYFEEDELAFYDPHSPEDLARVMVEMARDPQRRYQHAVKALKRIEGYSAEEQRRIYVDCVEKLVG